jgi:glycosyltransferase involved in cell wall biosynthesis
MVVYDVHENVPQPILSKKWINPILRYPISKLFSLVESICVQFFELVVVATPSISLRYPKQKTVIIQNFPVVEHVPGMSCGVKRGNIFLYVGGISIERGIGEVITALSCDERLRLQLVGKFDSRNTLNFVRSLNGWTNVDFIDWVARQDLPPFFSRAVAGLVTFHPIPNHIHSQPNKLFEYMEAGLPVIASNFPLWRQIIEKYDCGILVDPLNPLEISDAMRWILDHPEEAIKMGARGREAVLREFNWDAESLKLTECYERLIAAC